MDLKVAKLDFIGDTMWSFVDLDGRKISASIEDESFLKNIRTGKIKLSANVILKTRMRIELELDNFLNVQKKKHFIEEIYRTVEEPNYEQTTIDLDEVQ